MTDSINIAVGEEAKKMIALSGHISPWRVGRNLGLSDEIVVLHLTKLGYHQQCAGNFILKNDNEKNKVKESERLPEPDLSAIISNDMELPTQGFIQPADEEINYNQYKINELRAIASNKGIKGAFFMTKKELIKKIKSKLSG